ncbi:hypothetical protein Ga0609869_002132 [Rhodovulum iodosum]|uniref:Dihydroxy-acid dehydratase n=1 Tax=Rhodovulum iodosum TaxID=68291 RepID=A0ABV3XUM1_9RHOB|nr:dihydroxy-acid dehydratase [Rhodovulum robiginosum]RSK32212.1 dihydroxy-acid dehydratase [Rhodovulum robiginosum]
MIGRDSRDDIDGYGPWPWIGGLVLAGVIAALMFVLATPIS